MALDDSDDEEEDAKAADDDAPAPTDADLRARYGGANLSQFFETPDGQVIAVKAFPHFKPQNIPKTTEMMAEIERLLAVASKDEPPAAPLRRRSSATTRA